MRKLFPNNALVEDVAARDLKLTEVKTDAGSHARLGWLIVLLGFGGFILWATMAPLDKGVPVQGAVTVAGNRKVVQYQTTGTVEDILVKEGDVVKAGQVLVKMNEVQAKANMEITRVQYLTARAAEARLIAERDGKKTIAFPADLENAKSDPTVMGNISLQSQLFASRRAAFDNELAALEQGIQGLEFQKQGLQEAVDSQKTQMTLLKEQLSDMRDLVKDGYVARNRQLELERTLASVSASLAEGMGNLGKTQRQIAELTLRRAQRQQEYRKEVETQLADVQKESEALASRLKSVNFELDNVLVRAPVDGTVVGLSVFTKGGVVGPGARLMEIVPANDPLIIEGQVPVHLIDKVRKGLEVELIFVAFNQNKTPHIPGVVTQVSADRLADEKTGMPYYKIKAEVTPQGKKMLKHLEIKPGMPVEIMVKTGERTMMSYLLKPVFDRAKTALTEE